MNILIANKFHYRRGGDCVYSMNLERLLTEKGHKVATFAMQYPENIINAWSKYYPSEIRFTPNINMIESFLRPFGTKEVIRKFNSLLDDFQPNIVHLNNIHTQLSPIIAEIAHNKGIKVIWTLHDYKLLCPRYDCLKNGENICEECFSDKHKVLEYNCMKNSKIASFIAYKEAIKWNRKRLESCTDTFICPSQFMMNKMAQGGFSLNKLHPLCNFIDIDVCKQDKYVDRNHYYCFIGRLSHEKGVKTLIQAANQLQYPLIVAGSGPLENDLKKIATANIKFVGFQQWDEIKKIVGKARFSVIASEWYENNPFSVIESLCLGTPVLGAAIGGIPELIETSKNGLLFKSGHISDLKNKIQEMFQTSFDYNQISKEAQKRFSADNYYKEIIKIYEQ